MTDTIRQNKETLEWAESTIEGYENEISQLLLWASLPSLNIFDIVTEVIDGIEQGNG